MHGRCCPCLLILSSLILSPILVLGQSVPGQSVRSQSAPASPEFALPPSHGVPPPEAPDPVLPTRPLPPVTVGFPTVTRGAGIIFSGTVTAIARHPTSRASVVETVAITFHVESAIRGTTPGENLTISQWIGLWSGGQRYRVGERVLLFLYPPSKLGLTSTVAGAIGRFTIDPRGRVLLTARHLSAFRQDPVLGGKSSVSFSDFARAVRRVGEEE
jgi:hypothetical protein